MVQIRVFDLLDWLLPKSAAFPKTYRFTLTQRLMDSVLDLQDALAEAQGSRGQARRRALQAADVGRLVGGWLSRERTWARRRPLGSLLLARGRDGVGVDGQKQPRHSPLLLYFKVAQAEVVNGVCA